MENTIYRIIDGRTGQQIGKDYTYAQRSRARNRAEMLNLDYGAHRYSVRPVFMADDEAPELARLLSW